MRVIGQVLFWRWPPSASTPAVGLGHVLRRRFVSVTNTMVAVMLRHVWLKQLLRTGAVFSTEAILFRTGVMSGSSLPNPVRVPNKSAGQAMSCSASSERAFCLSERGMFVSVHESSADPDMPRQEWWIRRWTDVVRRALGWSPEWWIQSWTALVRKALGWRAPTRRGRIARGRRDNLTRAAIAADVARFLEEAETQQQGNNRAAP
ncbi:hypothetical protein N9L68_03435 [bacterium]|nr:hypothetical protein [bacterium]